ncbi:efflux RND transporter periplasmic adaptor subunit [Rhodanobacter sp. A1T4]|uniref:HlyD family secretion protein n=1 Tax=Rhodanobacter sp. A1T4 TaxID=2723087 RepID=UPI001610B476|nr:efflux RND transporter periplasmic adaptor subunit [Rhodanobacter sp. A1T4]MBB6249031.1 membrane fusion protein (multidrug efflux system) [Rhodanobacter sp. A1T4]
MTMADDDDTKGGPDSDAPPQQYRYRFKYLHKYGDAAPGSDGHGETDAQQPEDDPAKGDSNENDVGDGKEADDKKDDDKNKDGDGDKKKSPEEKRKEKKKKILVMSIIAAVFVLAALTWLLLYIFVFSQRETTDDSYVKGDMVTISSRVAGTVVEFTAEETDRVHAGQVLVRLDPADAEVALMNAQGQLAQAVREAETNIQKAKEADAAVAQRRAQYQNQRDDYARRHPLLDLHAVAKEDVDNSRKQTEAALAALQQAQSQAAGAHAQVDGVEVRDVPAVVQARSSFRNAWINSGRNAIVSPIDGYAARRQVQVGQRVQAGQDLLTIVPLSDLWVDANFKETQLEHIRIGQPVKITTDIYSDMTYHGKVVGLNAGTGSAFSLLPAENATGNWIKVVQRLPVRIALNPDDLRRHPLRIGLSADVNVDTHDRDGSVLVTQTREKPLASTDVYEREVKNADSHAEAIIRANMIPTPPSSTAADRSDRNR